MTNDPIRIGISQISFSLPIFLAKEQGLFEKNGLRVECHTEYPEAETLCKDIVDGSLDAGGEVALPIILDFETKQPGTLQFSNLAVEGPEHPFVYLLAKADKNIDRIKKLEGKTIGIFPTTAFDLWIKIILKKNNVNPDKCQIKKIDPSKHLKSLESDNVDVIFTNDPTATELLQSKDISKIVSSSLLDKYILEKRKGFPIGGFVLRRDFIKSHPLQAKKLVDVINKATDFLASNPKKAKDLCKKHYPARVQTLIPGITELNYWKDSDIRKKDLQDLVDIYYYNNLFDKPLNSTLLIYEPDYRIKVDKVKKSLSRRTLVLNNFDLEINKGEFVTFFGPNGCGKSTILNILSGQLNPDKGKITVDGESISEVKVGYVYQDYRKTLMPWKKTIDNIAFPLKIQGLSKDVSHKEVRDLCSLLGVNIDLDLYPNQLSGGQQQMVAILSALIDKPEILLLDEPFSALDYQTTIFLQEKIMDIWLRTGLSIIFISHDIDEAIFLANKICILKKRPTSIKSVFENQMSYPRKLVDKELPEFSQLKNQIIDVFTTEVKSL